MAYLPRSPDPADMTNLTTSAYTAAYATARSSLAALSDQTPSRDARRFERALLELDQIHDGVFPAIYPLVGSNRDLLIWFEGAIQHMIALGGDAVGLEFVLASALHV
jgi:hypothetical protein